MTDIIHPPREFDQEAAYLRAETAIGQTIAALPEFPGFATRNWRTAPCSHGNEAEDTGFVQVEVLYTFSPVWSAEPLVRQTYLSSLRQNWMPPEWELHRDEAGVNGIHSLEAIRKDGVNLYYRVAKLVTLHGQTGCVERADVPSLVAPLGGVETENDYAPDHLRRLARRAEAVSSKR
ncbi:hypothetical protein [Natronoglycomyces albus]|uniref:Uncharacterized protein n=1 Tax=Natronoglycomyces albus TaxID=2811108 RepID=A0A895XM61_9ACTN|nr:hypothetical protein [Natronoglycomyces albus]QSB04862.1 hypothetical protein JQS30_14000 [Natronoglycomyces albus]